MANLHHCNWMSKGYLNVCLIKSTIMNSGGLTPRKQQLQQTLSYLPAPAPAPADGKGQALVTRWTISFKTRATAQ